MTDLSIDGMRMHFVEHGNSDDPPLVLLHGFTQTGDFWENQIAPFSARYRLIAPDLRGHGRTDNPDGLDAMNHRQFARDIVALCRTLGIERAAFCGESSGSMLQLFMALDDPELVALCIFAGGSYSISDQARTFQQELAPDTMDREWRATLKRSHTAMGPEHWRTVVEAFHRLQTHTHEADYPETDRLVDIRQPVLIVHGDRDFFFGVEVPTRLYCLLPNAELCILPNTDHTPPGERPDWFNAIALDFLARRYDPERRASG